MGSQLTTEQVLLLENLMYLSTQEPLIGVENTRSRTIGNWINEINISQIQVDKDYGSCTTYNWKRVEKYSDGS